MTHNPALFLLDTELLLRNENCRCEYAFEGKTARDRAFENYLQEKGNDNERRAWALWQKARYPEWSEKVMDAVENALEELKELENAGSLVAAYANCEKDWNRLHRLEALGMFPSLEKLVVEDKFLPACGFFAERCWFFTSWFNKNYGKIEDLLTQHLDSEDCLLTAGRMAALDWQFSKDFVLQVQTALRDRAEKGHRDALRLLLFKTPLAEDDRFIHETWARNRLQELANADDPFALVYLGQQRYGLLPWWQPETESDFNKNLHEAADFFRRAAEQGDAWGKFYHTYITGVELEEEATNREYMKPIEELAREGFAPAMSYVGADLFNTDGYSPHAEELLRAACLKREQSACEKLYMDFLIWKFNWLEDKPCVPVIKELVNLAEAGFGQALLAAARISRNAIPEHYDQLLRLACRAGLDEAVGEAFLASRCFKDTTLDSEEIVLWLGEQTVQYHPHTLATAQMGYYIGEKTPYASRSQYLEHLGVIEKAHPSSPVATLLGSVYQFAILVRELDTVPGTADKARYFVGYMAKEFLSAVTCDLLDMLCAFALVVPLLRHHLQTSSLNLATGLIGVALFGEACTPEELQRKFNFELTERDVDLALLRKNFGLVSSGTSNKRRDKKKKSSRKRR